MKIEIKIRQVAESRGLKTAYQLQKKAGLKPSTASRLYRNQVSQITLETLDKLLDALDCDASDLFVRPRSGSRSKGKKV